MKKRYFLAGLAKKSYFCNRKTRENDDKQGFD